MLSFKALSEKKTKIKINPKQADITEMENNHGEDCDCMKCEKKRRKEGGEKEVATEAKVYDPMEDDTFDHDEAEATRGQSGKNKSITIKKKTKKTTKEETAYVSQEEVSEESNQESTETETFLTFGQFIEARNAYAVGMAAAMKQTGDEPPLEKSTIKKAHKIAKAIKKEEVELDEATRAAKEGKKDEHRVGVEIRAKQAATSLAAKRARQKVLDAHEKKTGKKLDISKSPEGKTHAKHFGGSRQTKKVKGEKETDLETHNRRVGRSIARKLKHGKTSKEQKYDAAMAKHTSRFD